MGEKATNPIIEIKDLNKSFGDVKAVQDLSVCVKKGGLFAFLGGSTGRKRKCKMEYIITTSNLTKSYHGKTIVDRVNLHVKKGEIHGFVGSKNAVNRETPLQMFLMLIVTLAIIAVTFRKNVESVD